MFETEQEESAQEFIDRVRRLFSSKSNIIYNFDGEVKKSNVISPSTVSRRNAWIYVELYNVSNPDELFDKRTWMKLGELGADVDTWNHGGDYALMEITKQFD